MLRVRLPLCVILTSFLFASCYKAEVLPFKKPTKALKGCTAASFFGVPAGESDFLNGFTKQFDGNGRVSQVVAPSFGLILSDSLRMNLAYGTNTVFFVTATMDTVLRAYFNPAGKLQKIEGQDDYGGELGFPTTEYLYTNNRLSSIKVFNTEMKFQYDAKGNVTKYTSDNEDGLDNYVFSYDLTQKVGKQIYIDYVAGWIYNTFTLSQIMDWTPDLSPAYKRTHATILFNKTEPWYDVEFTDHTFDSQGRLTSYLAGEYKMFITWNCK